jgi:hypothetical protein
MTQRTAGIRIVETPEEREAFDAKRRQEFIEELRELDRAKKQRVREIPLIKEATAKMEWLITTGCGASEGAAAILKYCYRGGRNHTLKYDDLAGLDPKNTELALLLIGTVARQKHTFPEEYLSSVGLELFQ